MSQNQERLINELQTTLESLEVKVAYQDDTIESLNQIVIKQDAQIQQLSHGLKKLMDKFKSLDVSDLPSNEQIELPPHY